MSLLVHGKIFRNRKNTKSWFIKIREFTKLILKLKTVIAVHDRSACLSAMHCLHLEKKNMMRYMHTYIVMVYCDEFSLEHFCHIHTHPSLTHAHTCTLAHTHSHNYARSHRFSRSCSPYAMTSSGLVAAGLRDRSSMSPWSRLPLEPIKLH